MSKHTPGPWEARGHIVMGKDEMPVAAIWVQGYSLPDNPEPEDVRKFADALEKDKANARLIAAAPEMLEALENIENDDAHMPAAIWDLIQKAIAKAKGGE